MKGRLSAEHGMSLVEATIILLLLSILTAVVAPSMGDYVEDARNVKAKEDVEAIGTGILRTLRDVGLPCLSTDGDAATSPASSGPCSKSNRVDLLIGDGTEPDVTAAAFTLAANTINAAATSVNWAGSTASGTSPNQTNLSIPSADRDTIEDQLMDNDDSGVVYTGVSFTMGGGPRSGLGWRGAYLTGPVGADPWGFTYQANTVFLTTAADAGAGTTEGLLQGGWSFDVLVVSAGSNATIQTPFANAGNKSVGDDIIYVLQGASR